MFLKLASFLCWFASLSAAFGAVNHGSVVNAGMLLTDVTAISSGLPATAVKGVYAGNNLGSSPNFLDGLNAGEFSGYEATWTLAGSSDTNDFGPFTSNPEATSGTLLFDVAINGPFVIVLKAGNNFGAYFFDGMLSDVTGVNFTTQGLKDPTKRNPPALSHASLYLFDGTDDIPPVPEPTTVMLWTVASLSGLAYSRIKKTKVTA